MRVVSFLIGGAIGLVAGIVWMILAMATGPDNHLFKYRDGWTGQTKNFYCIRVE